MIKETSSNSDKLKAVNCSGFPFQIAVEEFVKSMTYKYGRRDWDILYREHPWHDAESNQRGFIDIILLNSNKTKMLVIECKRFLDTDWIFLNPDPKQISRAAAQTIVMNTNEKILHWTSEIHEPNSPISMFAVVNAKKDAKRVFSIDQIASELIAATEAFVEDEIANLDNFFIPDTKTQYCSVIITTAQLFICPFDPKSILLTTGELPPTTEVKKIPFIRFEKQLSTKKYKIIEPDGSTSYERARNHNVFIVNVESLEEFLKGMAAEP